MRAGENITRRGRKREHGGNYMLPVEESLPARAAQHPAPSPHSPGLHPPSCPPQGESLSSGLGCAHPVLAGLYPVPWVLSQALSLVSVPGPQSWVLSLVGPLRTVRCFKKAHAGLWQRRAAFLLVERSSLKHLVYKILKMKMTQMPCVN